jgi:hypothetical protein
MRRYRHSARAGGNCKEIIVQDGHNTKMTGLKWVLSALRQKRDFHGKFIVFTHGNSSNDLGMLVWANGLVEAEELPGGSVWVGDDIDSIIDTSKYCLESVEVFQLALVILAGKLQKIAGLGLEWSFGKFVYQILPVIVATCFFKYRTLNLNLRIVLVVFEFEFPSIFRALGSLRPPSV